MASFDSYSKLIEAIAGSVQNGKTSVGREVSEKKNKILLGEATKYATDLQRIINKYLDEYYNSYDPVVHKRTKQLYKMLGNIDVDNESNVIIVHFNQNAWQTNVVQSEPHSSFVPMLLNTGWEVKKSNKGGRRFLYFEGSFFLDNAIEEFNVKYAKLGVHATKGWD